IQDTVAYPVLSAPTPKRAEKYYYVPAKDNEYRYSHPPPGSLVVSAANEQDRLRQMRAIPKNKDAKKLDLLKRKVYSTASLQLRLSNQQALLGRYDFSVWNSVAKFTNSLSQELRQEFLAVMDEGKAVARASL
ncbi:hypothetical protein UY3_06050, partial [Chelonia mydas]